MSWKKIILLALALIKAVNYKWELLQIDSKFSDSSEKIIILKYLKMKKTNKKPISPFLPVARNCLILTQLNLEFSLHLLRTNGLSLLSCIWTQVIYR